MAQLDLTKVIQFFAESMGASTAKLLNDYVAFDNRLRAIVVEWEQLTEQQNLSDLKEQNLERREEDFRRSGVEYTDENEQKFLELLRDFQSSLDTGNDLVWIVREKERLAAEYADIVLIQKPKLRLQEQITKINFERSGRLTDLFSDIRDVVQDAVDGLTDIREQVASLPFPYGPILDFLLSEIIKYIELNFLQPLIAGVLELTASAVGLRDGVLGNRGINL